MVYSSKRVYDYMFCHLKRYRTEHKDYLLQKINHFNWSQIMLILDKNVKLFKATKTNPLVKSNMS